MRFSIYESQEYIAQNGEDEMVWVVTGSADTLSTARAFVKDIANCLVRDTVLDVIVLLKKS